MNVEKRRDVSGYEAKQKDSSVLPASRISTVLPGRMISGRRMASQLARRRQPALRARPMVSGSEVPGMPMPERLVPHQMTPTGLLGPAGIMSALLVRLPRFFWG